MNWKLFHVNGDVLPDAPTAVNFNSNNVPAPAIGFVPKTTTLSMPDTDELTVTDMPLVKVPEERAYANYYLSWTFWMLAGSQAQAKEVPAAQESAALAVEHARAGLAERDRDPEFHTALANALIAHAVLGRTQFTLILVAPRWGHALAWGWMATLYLRTDPPQKEPARRAAESALRLRPDFWSVREQVLPQLQP